MQERIREMFENLMQVEHPNIVKFHKYWLDMRENRARVRYKNAPDITSAPVTLALDSHVKLFISCHTGDFYHRIHVIWKS